jgi:hypothetical protein
MAARTPLGDGEGLAGEHRRLVRAADPRQVQVGVEAGGDRLPKAGQEGRAIAAVLDVGAHLLRFLQVPDDDEVASGLAAGPGGGGPGLLVRVLAVDEGGVAGAGEALDVLPDVEHGATGGIHQHHLPRPQRLHVAEGDAEGGEEDDVVGEEVLHRHPVPAVQEPDPHLGQAPVDAGVVDDLAGDEDPALGELLPRLVGVLDRPVHAVAEPELAGQAEGERARLQAVPLGAHALHQRGVVIAHELWRHHLLEAQAAIDVAGLGHDFGHYSPGVAKGPFSPWRRTPRAGAVRGGSGSTWP